MNRIFLLGACGGILLAVCSASAAEWTPLQLSLWPPVQLIPGNEALTIGGLRLDVPYGHTARVLGFDLGIVNRAGEIIGLQVGVANPVKRDLAGLQVGVFNRVEREVRGVQVGVWNQAGGVKGVQLGLVNLCERVAGIQLGLVNSVRNRSAGVLPFANAGF